MWNPQKQHLLDTLRLREEQAALTPAERQQLEDLLRELEQDEWATLRPALETHHEEVQRLQDELGQIQTQNAALAALAKRYMDLLSRAKAHLDGLVSERDTLRAEYERVLRQAESGGTAAERG